MERNIWKETFAEDKKTKYPCPRCHSGKLEPMKITFYDRETAESLSMRKDPNWEEDWYEGRFSGILQCDDASCREVVAVTGKASFGTDWDMEGEEFNFSEYHPLAFHPPLCIIDMPEWATGILTRLFQRSFSLYWSGPTECRRILLALIEIRLKKKGISRRKLGNRARLPLFERLTGSGLTPDEINIILKNLSCNIKGTSPVRDDLLDLYEILEKKL